MSQAHDEHNGHSALAKICHQSCISLLVMGLAALYGLRHLCKHLMLCYRAAMSLLLLCVISGKDCHCFLQWKVPSVSSQLLQQPHQHSHAWTRAASLNQKTMHMQFHTSVSDCSGAVCLWQIIVEAAKVYGVSHSNRISRIDVVTREDALEFVQANLQEHEGNQGDENQDPN